MTVLDKFRLEGKKAIVTGAAQGLGRAMARGLAEAGADVAIPDLQPKKARQTSRAFREEIGVDAFAVETDVTDVNDVQNMVEEVVDRWGRIDILLNNAGIVRNDPAEEMSDEDWYEVVDVNLNGVFLCAREVGKIMVEQREGVVINLSSTSSFIVDYPQCQVSYNAAKAGVTMITKSLASEWAKHNIRVNAIAPGYMDTPLTQPFVEENPETVERYWTGPTPMDRLGQPEELAGAAVYLASEASSFTTGETLVIDGGYTTR